MKYLIIGASGFLGGTALRVLRQGGHTATGTRAHSPREDLIPFDLLHDRLADHVPAELLARGGETCAVVCACICQVDRCYREREVTKTVNVDHTIRLIQDLRSRGFRVVFISTGHVFDGRTGYYSEDEPLSPIHEYGRHKAAVETWIRQNAPETLILRPGKLVSDRLDASNMFAEWYRDAAAGRPITCIADQVLAPTLADDVVRALMTANDLGLTGTYHVSNTEFFVRDELARQFARALTLQVPVVVKRQEEFNFAEPRPVLDYLDSTKFLEATNFRFTTASAVFARLRTQVSAR
jgi:dTDP-4-dehydrorhamnose reductase